MPQFFASDDRIKTVRKMIMAVTPEQRKVALDQLLPYQRSDFEGIFRAMDGKFSSFFFFFPSWCVGTMFLVIRNSVLIHVFLQISGLPVTIRLLDPPLHEFLPEGDLDQIVKDLASETGMTDDEVYSRIEKLSEVNPMLGFRGCR